MDDYGNASTPARTYNYTYLTDSNYTSRHITNRMTLATVTAPSGTTTLFSTALRWDELGALAGQSGLIPHYSAYDYTFPNRGNPTSTSSMGTSMA